MRIPIDNLRPDMTLGADLVDGGGRLLLPNGTVITEKHIRYCQMWGIAEIEIAGSEPEAEPERAPDPVKVAAAEAAVRPRFAHVQRGHPVIEALFAHCVQKQLQRSA